MNKLVSYFTSVKARRFILAARSKIAVKKMADYIATKLPAYPVRLHGRKAKDFSEMSKLFNWTGQSRSAIAGNFSITFP